MKPELRDMVLNGSADVLSGMAKALGKNRALADLSMGMLQRLGPLHPPGYAPNLDAATPPEPGPQAGEFGKHADDCHAALRLYLAEVANRPGRPVFLDVGGNKGECRGYARGFEYWILDLSGDAGPADRVIIGDACGPLDLPDGSVDVVFSNNVWEHLESPWEACAALGRVLRPGGLFITITIMAYRYHPFPEDYFRYTHAGLARLHERHAGTTTLACKYDLVHRRHDHRGGAHPQGADRVPVDYLGGFRENWFVYYIGKKPRADSSAEAAQ